MTTQVKEHDHNERRTLALVFLASFVALAGVLVWLLYGQVAQVALRSGNCTVLSAEMQAAAVNDMGGQNDGTNYYLVFKVALTTANGQQVTVPGYYGSTSYDFATKASAQAALQHYAVGSTVACSYTFLDSAGTKAMFAPGLPWEGIGFISFLLLISLTLVVICARALKIKPSLSPELADLVEPGMSVQK
jgi:hypothetical protein